MPQREGQSEARRGDQEIDPAQIESRMEAARRLSMDAGRSTLKLFLSERIEFVRKGDDTPVTRADRDAEMIIRREIEASFPGDGIVGEEFGTRTGQSGFDWVLDPIDGTKSFITGVPLFGTMVGVSFLGRPVIGAIYFPGLDEGIFAAQGQGSWWVRNGGEPVRARCSSRTQLGECTFLTSEVKTFEQVGAQSVYQQLENTCYITRTWGDCYGYLLVATGRADVMIDPVLNLWDAAAAKPIVEESGGRFTDWSGIEYDAATQAIGCNPHVHDQVVALTRPHATRR